MNLHPGKLGWPAFYALQARTCRNPALRAYYQAGCPAAELAIGAAPLLALDVETTGLDAQRDAIVSLGLIPFDLQRIRCSEARYWVVNPQRELPERSVTIHRITHSQIHQAPPFAAIAEELLEALRGRLVVVHYRTIERLFLHKAVRQALGESLSLPMIDTMQLEASLQRRQHPPGWLDRLFGRRPVSVRLADSRRRYNLPAYQAHHALSDALACAELLQAQIAHHYSPHTPLRQLWY
ncbi:3'-5' exonuclease [Pseudomonas fluvialis]|jgi:DNA polymerase-3 subunit epsilon|uniref:3'-5' exonuclease n=1 Tax=Pseudomonas fluvialis TaxID=1793966 RepID=A0ABQ2AVF1_9PSED|nr:3'-5' exonuclease [Pseudomonas fluvialis]OXM41024.1 DNA polymerase III subunit epsilon [Pseudomonas fluvialis]GGH96207.1 3'-5' exonuclease [Pseudomonas fluvialis]